MRTIDRHRGFTLVEMIVAMSVAALMLYMINRIFFDTTRAISRGIAVSDSIQNSRAVSYKIEEDADAMVAPDTDTGGFLVILQKQYTSVPIMDPTVSGGMTNADIRSDQLMFIRTTTSTDRPLVPQDAATYTYQVDTAHAAYPFWNHARVWYGHVRRTSSDGTDTGVPDIGDPADTGSPNRIGTRWILGSQTMFLGRSINVPGTIAYYDDPGNQWRYPDHEQAGTIPAGAGFQATLPAGIANGPIYTGVIDIGVVQAKVASNGWGGGAEIVGLEALTGQASTDATTVPQPLLAGTGPLLPATPLIADFYALRAYRLMYGDERLRVNPDIQPGNLESWRIAQTHGYLVPRVSDFIVEFAGDYDGVGGIDVTSAESDNDKNGVAYTIEANSIKWYGHYSNSPDAGSPDTTFDSLQPLVYPIPSSNFAAGDDTAGLPDTVAPIYDTTGDRPALCEAALVFRHDDDGTGTSSRWPYLLRIRYRMHDQRGELRSNNGQHGIWFEQIIKVNRP